MNMNTTAHKPSDAEDRDMTSNTAFLSEISKVEVELETKSGEKREYEYEVKGDRTTGTVETRSSGGNKSKRNDEGALEKCIDLLKRMAVSRRMTPDEILERAFSALQVSRDQIKKIEVEIKYVDGTEVEVKLKQSGATA